MAVLGTLVTFLLALAKLSVVVVILLIAIPLALVLFLLGAAGRWNAGRTRQSNKGGDGTVDLVKCPTCGDWVEGECEKPGCAATGGGEG